MLILQKRARQSVGGGAGSPALAGTQQHVAGAQRSAASSLQNAASSQRDAEALARARSQKLTCIKVMEQRKLRLISLRDKFDEHVPSEVLVRGTLFPGAVLECHGRRYEVRTEKKMITLRFDPAQGKIVEKI